MKSTYDLMNSNGDAIHLKYGEGSTELFLTSNGPGYVLSLLSPLHKVCVWEATFEPVPHPATRGALALSVKNIERSSHHEHQYLISGCTDDLLNTALDHFKYDLLYSSQLAVSHGPHFLACRLSAAIHNGHFVSVVEHQGMVRRLDTQQQLNEFMIARNEDDQPEPTYRVSKYTGILPHSEAVRIQVA
jgi:hypothetical protein